MPPKLIRGLVVAVAACAFAATALAADGEHTGHLASQSIVLGKTPEYPESGCPAPDKCEVVARVTGIQMRAAGVEHPFKAPSSGQLVAWWLKLPKLRSTQIRTFNGLFGGEPAAPGSRSCAAGRAGASGWSGRARASRCAVTSGQRGRVRYRLADAAAHQGGRLHRADARSPGCRRSRSTSTPPATHGWRAAASAAARRLRAAGRSSSPSTTSATTPSSGQHGEAVRLLLSDRAPALLGADRARRRSARRHFIAARAASRRPGFPGRTARSARRGCRLVAACRSSRCRPAVRRRRPSPARWARAGWARPPRPIGPAPGSRPSWCGRYPCGCSPSSSDELGGGVSSGTDCGSCRRCPRRHRLPRSPRRRPVR